MKLTKYLICSVLLLIGAQEISAKEIQIRSIEECRKYALATQDFRGIREIWSSTRQGAIVTWNYIKSVAESTKEKIKIFFQNVKDYAKDLMKKFEERIQDLRNRLNEIIAEMYGTGEQVKQCMKQEKKNMEQVLKDILAHMGQCIADEISQLATWSHDEPEQLLNQTQFLSNLDDNFDMCEQDMTTAQNCLTKVRVDLFDNFTDMENSLLKSHFEAKSIGDDIKETLVTCSISNLIEATKLVLTEVVEIAQCVIELKENDAENNNNVY